ncbi:hypothetical protein [Cellulophaga baltica]|uniref:hypothetical protein n=1 Tax=Cellulophaga baltica TaxID=76594 RepID=UPI0015F4FD80|nr:hypothetical protein [Cellulophaga baltica]
MSFLLRIDPLSSIYSQTQIIFGQIHHISIAESRITAKDKKVIDKLQSGNTKLLAFYSY